MSEAELRKMLDLDEAADQAGGFLAKLTNTNVSFDYRGILRYCREKGIEPVDITVRELNTFIQDA